jgi:hypothetical protein
MVVCRCRQVGTRLVVFLAVLLTASSASALRRLGPLEIAGSISAQNLVRHPDIDEWAFVQQRNTVKLRLDYNMIDKGKFIERFEIPGVESAHLFMLYRGVYDSVYDYSPSFDQKDIYGFSIGLNNRLEDLGHDDETKFENRLREAYIDLRLKAMPLSMRLGRQQIVWGETDNFRLLDRVNSLDLTWHLQQESWDELRIPYWMIKLLYDVGRVGVLSDAFFEAYWNPGDWYPNKRAFLPRPWSVPATNPLELAGGFLGTQRLANDTRLFGQGDYHRNPGDNSQMGIRFNAVAPPGIQFTFNYFYQRWAGGDDGTNSAAVKAILDETKANEALAKGTLPVEATYPYVHAFGVSLNYADDERTLAVYRTEMVYELGVPFNDASKPSPNPILQNDVFGVSKRDMWKGTIAFDRPTWIRFLNRRTTFLLLGQFFWHYLIDNPQILCRDPTEGLPCTNSNQGHGFRGALSSSKLQSLALAASRNPHLRPDQQIVDPPAFFDRVRDWELLMTLAATTFYKGGSIMPLVVYVLDPVNKYNMEFIWSVDYFFTPNFIINVGQKFFVNTTSDPVFETWGVGGVNRGRSETQLKLTYQF